MGARPLKRAIDNISLRRSRHHRGKAVSRRRAVSLRAQRRRGHSGRFVDPDADVAAADQRRLLRLPSRRARLDDSRTGRNAGRIHALQAEYDGIERTLASGEWENLKESLSGDMSSADFWHVRIASTRWRASL